MNIDCRVIGDLLPLYADESCSDASRALIEEHVRRTASPRGIKMLYQFESIRDDFVKVIPRDYARVLAHVAEAEGRGATREEALSYAFDAMREA